MTLDQFAVQLPAAAGIYAGNAAVDAQTDLGWILGHFKPVADPRRSGAVEVKWGKHPEGDRRAAWVTGEHRTAMLILISGRFQVEFRDRTVRLANRGDYVTWGPGVDHCWYAENESIVLTVRWPSVPGYVAATK